MDLNGIYTSYINEDVEILEIVDRVPLMQVMLFGALINTECKKINSS